MLMTNEFIKSKPGNYANYRDIDRHCHPKARSHVDNGHKKGNIVTIVEHNDQT